jgi:tetratricopeptide (TPR) repeat protein
MKGTRHKTVARQTLPEPDLSCTRLNPIYRFDVSFHIDEKLHEIPNNPEQMQQALDYLQEQLLNPNAVDERVQARLYGLIGVYARILGDFCQAREALMAAIALSKELKDVRLLALNLLRLAQVYQWQHQYELSDRLIEEALSYYTNNPTLSAYLDFAYQYAGKCKFEQQQYQKAHWYFEQALIIRQRRGNPSLLKATQLVLELTRKRLSAVTEQAIATACSNFTSSGAMA